MANPFGYTKPADEPERVSDSTQIIDLSKHEGETKTSVFSGESIETVQLEDTTEEDEFAITLAGLKTVPVQENEEIELQETRVDIPQTSEKPAQTEESEAQPEEAQVVEQPEETAESAEIAEPVEAEQTAEAEEEPERVPEAVEEQQEEAAEQSETAEVQSEDAEEATQVIDLAEKSEPTEQLEEDVVSQDTVVRPLTENEQAAEPAVQQVETAEPVEETEKAEDMQEETEEEPKKKRRFTLRLLLPILLLAASVVFASLHMQMPEITFLLIFLCYVFKYYRITAFACLILCVRSGLDVYIQYLQSGVQDAAVNAVSAVVFLIIGIVCVWASAAQKKDE